MMRGLILVAAVFLTACGGDEESDPRLAAYLGKSFAEIEVQTLDGEVQKVKDVVLFEKKPVILNVWATWCTPCLAEMPGLDALGKQGKYHVVGLASDESATVVKEFLKQQTWGRGVQVWFDPVGRVARGQMGVQAYPTTFVLDEKLIVRKAFAGPKDWARFK